MRGAPRSGRPRHPARRSGLRRVHVEEDPAPTARGSTDIRGSRISRATPSWRDIAPCPHLTALGEALSLVRRSGASALTAPPDPSATGVPRRGAPRGSGPEDSKDAARPPRLAPRGCIDGATVPSLAGVRSRTTSAERSPSRAANGVAQPLPAGSRREPAPRCRPPAAPSPRGCRRLRPTARPNGAPATLSGHVRSRTSPGRQGSPSLSRSPARRCGPARRATLRFQPRGIRRGRVKWHTETGSHRASGGAMPWFG